VYIPPENILMSHETFSVGCYDIYYIYEDIIKPRIGILHRIIDVQRFLGNQLCLHLGANIVDDMETYQLSSHLASDVIIEFKKRLDRYSTALLSIISESIKGNHIVDYSVVNGVLYVHTVKYTHMENTPNG
jgi:hypothetical protein